VNANGLSPRPQVDVAAVPAVGQAGSVLLPETLRAAGLGAEHSRALGPWRKEFAVHDPEGILVDLAPTLALGGDCLANTSLHPED
jgi:hypothetical protein